MEGGDQRLLSRPARFRRGLPAALDARGARRRFERRRSGRVVSNAPLQTSATFPPSARRGSFGATRRLLARTVRPSAQTDVGESRRDPSAVNGPRRPFSGARDRLPLHADPFSALVARDSSRLKTPGRAWTSPHTYPDRRDRSPGPSRFASDLSVHRSLAQPFRGRVIAAAVRRRYGATTARGEQVRRAEPSATVDDWGRTDWPKTVIYRSVEFPLSRRRPWLVPNRERASRTHERRRIFIRNPMPILANLQC